jgi:hypothetical protein
MTLYPFWLDHAFPGQVAKSISNQTFLVNQKKSCHDCHDLICGGWEQENPAGSTKNSQPNSHLAGNSSCSWQDFPVQVAKQLYKAACYWGLKVTVLPKVVVISVKQFGKTRVIGAEFTQIGVKFSVTLKTLLKTGSFSVTFSDFTENGVTIDFQKSIGSQFGRFWSRLFWVFCMTVWVFSQ